MQVNLVQWPHKISLANYICAFVTMFSSSLRYSLTLLAAYGVAISAASTTFNLSVKTWTPDVNIDRLINFKVTTTIVNTGGETLKLLNHPRGVLDPFPEDTFIITDSSGSHSLLRGAKVDRASGD